MKKPQFICTECKTTYAKWAGQCQACKAWNSIEEMEFTPHSKHQTHSMLEPTTLITHNIIRIQTNIQEFNHVCGGGIVPGGVILIGGEPGIGKSTLLLQICNKLQASAKPLYISGEEAATQVAMRAQRLHVDTTTLDCAFGTQLSEICNLITHKQPSLVIIDSIQTLYSEDTESNPGSLKQITYCAQILMELAKKHNIPLIIVGHITKDGALAGPKALEHMVDAVPYFEGERSSSSRILRAVKNRFGPTNEIGIFEMNEDGLQEVINPSNFFLNPNLPESPGVIIFPSIEGSRPLLIELQALTINTSVPVPNHAVVGWNHKRLDMIAAVIENKLKIKLSQKKIYVNIVGGLNIYEPAADLAVALAIISANYMFALPRNMIAFGEIGLAGEIRIDQHSALKRLEAASKLGIKSAITPILHDSVRKSLEQKSNLKIIECKTILDLTDFIKSLKNAN